ncbi:hypothetical protein KOW79_017470 [Hemibagrus wyckioides]|uniref:Uncharacterized protein n=1 Tax=Hemibagrus wyckioides TaxID=337641 RepID=A0A9D3SC31_9TELE|nr:hypothetical protein KOW79_017470 [Hemibagrus wyckioides]
MTTVTSQNKTDQCVSRSRNRNRFFRNRRPKTQKLEERVKELEALLCEARRDYDLKSKKQGQALGSSEGATGSTTEPTEEEVTETQKQSDCPGAKKKEDKKRKRKKKK